MGQWLGKASTGSSGYEFELKILDDLLRLAATKEAMSTQIIQHDVGTESRDVAENSALSDIVSTTETDQQALLNNAQKRHGLLGMEPGTEEWLATVEVLIRDEKFDEAKGMVEAKEKLSVDHDDIWEKLIVAGLGFQVRVKSDDEEGAWNRFWQSLRLMLNIVEVDGGKLEAPFMQRLVTGSIDEFYELLVREKSLRKCTLCLQAGAAISAIFSDAGGLSLCFQNMGGADEASSDEACSDEASCSDQLCRGEAHEILYRLFGFTQLCYESTRMGNLLAEQSFQLLLLHDNILFTTTETLEASLCLSEEWKQFGAGDYVTAIEKLRKWIGEINSVAEKKMEYHGGYVDEKSFAAWQRELEIKSSGFLGLYHFDNKDYVAAEKNLLKSIRSTLEHHTELDSDSDLLQNVVYLFGNALFDTLRELGKSDPKFERTFDHQISVVEALPFKYLLEYQFGKWLFEAGHKRLDETVMNRSLELLWESSRGLVQVGDIESAIFAYADSVGVAMVMNEDNFDKPWEIVEEALNTSEIRDDENFYRLWEVLWDVAKNSCKPIQKSDSVYRLQRAIKGLKEAESLALQETVEENCIVFHSKIRFLMAELLVGYTKASGIANAREQLDEAIKLLKDVWEQLEERQKRDGESFSTEAIELLEEARSALRGAYGLAGEHRKAAETVLYSCSESPAESQRTTVLLKSAEAMSLSSWGLHNRAIEVIKEAILEVESSPDPELRGDWQLQVSLLFNRSSINRKAGQMEKSLEDMENAKEGCKPHDFAFGGNMEILEGFFSLLEHYINSKDYKSAWELVKDIDATARNDFAKGPTGKFVDKYAYWNYLLSKLLMLRTEHEGKETSGFWNQTASPELTAESGLVFTPFLMDAMCNTEMPLAKRHAVIDDEKSVIRRDGQPSQDVQTPLSNATRKNLFQCYLYLVDRNGEGAVGELQKAIENLESLPSGSSQNHTSLDTVHLYALQALVYGALGSRLDAYASIERAKVLMKRTQKEYDPVYLHAKRYVEFYVNESPQIAADAGRELLSRFTDGQLQIPSAMEFGWVQTLDDKAFLYRRMELIAIEQNNPIEALVWAERGQMRLFMHIAENESRPLRATAHGHESTFIPTETKAEGKFDRDDEYAGQILFKALDSCPPNVAIIKYSYSNENESLVVYLITKEEWRMRVIPDMGRECGQLLNDPKLLSQTFAQHVKKLLDTITIKKDDPTAKRYLSNLFQLMIKPELLHLTEACDTLVFVHHGILSLLPLHALYDDSKEKFLIQQKRVCYIPSIRVLRYCYDRQDEFVRSFDRGELKPPFLAGDPEPMGTTRKKMRQLRAARKEAKAVAEILLGNESYAFVGEMVTKQAVKEALCNSSLTLLSTHFYNKALVLQARGQQQQRGLAQSANYMQQTQVDQSPDLTAATRNRTDAYENTGMAVHQLARDIGSNVDEEELIRGATTSEDGEFDEEELSIAEIGQLRVRSGVVVLDGCGTNAGQVSQEGLLGLGRALLLAGAPITILSLWSVNDTATGILVTSLFENAKTKQLDVLGSLQKAMDDMIKKGGKKIYHWAPLIALGSPTMQLPLAKTENGCHF